MRTGILIALLAASTACAAPLSAQFREKLAANLGKVETVEAAFIQNRRLKSLDMTLAITGRLALEKGKRMAWLVREPMRYMCVISEQGLAQWDGDSRRGAEALRKADSVAAADLRQPLRLAVGGPRRAGKGVHGRNVR